ncbi:MAG: HAD family hydrolase [Synechococcaceae bacterium WBB_10_009]|jgi:HAD superfamily hydrolase (TIGR01509 family)|nr:HAD family hydrolase [Synechococcaceae bacterium WBB_10_009]
MSPPPAALLWDVDGTLAETELLGHRRAFNRAFAEAGLPWRWDPPTYLQLLAISGGRERLRHFLTDARGQPPAEAEVEALQASKTRHYTALVAAGELVLRPGVRRLMAEVAAAGLPQAIVTTSGRAAVQALLDGQLPQHAQWLPLWICGEDVARKKPHPQAYQLALQRLGCCAATALAIEDSANGVAAASAAGLPVLVTRSASSAAEPAEAFAAAAAELDGLGDAEAPVRVRRGPACPGGRVTLSYLQHLLSAR